MNSLWKFFRFYVIPILFIFGCPTFIFFLTNKFRNIDIRSSTVENVLGNSMSWVILVSFATWAFLSLKIPSQKYFGPTTQFGFTPVYRANGIAYYIVTSLVFIFLCYVVPSIPETIYVNLPQIFATTNITAILLCMYLLVKGKFYPQSQEKVEESNLIFEFYRGMEVHPTFFNVDVKQFTNCRFGLMSWQLLIIAYFVVSFNKYGVNPGLTVSVLIQSAYLCKFFYWETGYFDTLDITLDRAGFYICWGCLQFLPGFYAFTTYFYVLHQPQISTMTSLLCLIVGIAAIVLTYLVDREKEIFKSSNGTKGLFSDKVTFVKTEYKTKDGRKRGKLLTSGFWGVSRHVNYVFELLAYYSWSVPGIYSGVWSFMCAIFLTVLLVHRVFRDEDKCAKKYGLAWDEYCNKVKYRMIPGIF